MPAAATPRGSASGGLLSIGQVLQRLNAEHPGLSASKLRFFEQQGLITPTRTPSGYRKFTPADVERLRLALQLQRDHYLPLTVIRDYLDERDAGKDPSLPSQPPPSIHPRGRRYRRDELAASAGAHPQLVNEAIATGLLAPAESYDERDVNLLRALAALEASGIEPRHLRGVRQAVEREIALIESVVAPLMRKPDAGSRGRAGEIAPEIARRLDDVRQSLMRSALAKLLP